VILRSRPVVAVVDGQGGGIGRLLVEKLRARLGEAVEIWAFGTNAQATSPMLKAGADEGATGENPIVQYVDRARVICGTVSIVAAHAMMGEVTAAMAEAVAAARAPKLLLPLNRSGITVIGSSSEPLPHLADELAEHAARLVAGREGERG